MGEGANACVYKCVHKKTGRIYAAKKLKIEEEHVLELKRNFINLKELRHPSIIKYKALYLDLKQHCAFLIMECFDKPSLLEWKAKGEGRGEGREGRGEGREGREGMGERREDLKVTREEELKVVMRELVNSIQYLHHRNICHRDLKPDNILYCHKSKAVKIIDFGISRKTYQRGARRDMLTVIGTHFYQAPEVYLGGGYDERIDLWALGVTAYKMITGRTPFESEYHSTTIQNIVRCEVGFS